MTIFDAATTLKVLLGANIIGGHEVTDEGGLDISWLQGAIFNTTTDLMVNSAAGSDTLTDDDTNYLKWKSGTALVVELTTATGNEVLIATIITAAGDISSITEVGFDFSSVSGLDGRPIIKFDGDKSPQFHATYGQIIIEEENLVDSLPKFSFRTEKYRIIVGVVLDKTGPAILKAILSQMDSIFITNNKDHANRDNWWFNLKGGWNTNYISGLVRLVIDTRKTMRAL